MPSGVDVAINKYTTSSDDKETSISPKRHRGTYGLYIYMLLAAFHYVQIWSSIFLQEEKCTDGEMTASVIQHPFFDNLTVYCSILRKGAAPATSPTSAIMRNGNFYRPPYD
jgi:hypothetical protein